MRRLMALVLLLSLGLGGFVLAQSPPTGPNLAPGAKAAVLMDAATGQILYEKNANQPLPPASMTKLMTLVLAVRALDQGTVTRSQMVSISEGAYQMGGSQIWLEPGEQISFGDLLNAVGVASANDAAVAIGEYLAGSEENFVRQMNQTAGSLGMKNTTFINPHGLDAQGHLTTALDMAILGRYAVGLPGLLQLTRQWETKEIRDGKGGKLWLVNPNRLLRTYRGADGLKTGFTSAAGYCLIGTASRDGLRLVAVVMGEPSAKERNAEATGMFNYGFANFKTLTLAGKGQGFGTVRVVRGHPDKVAAVAATAVAVLVKRTGGKPGIQVQLPASVQAPVEVGQVLGSVAVRLDGRKVAGIPLVAANGSRRLNLLTAWLATFRWIAGNFPF